MFCCSPFPVLYSSLCFQDPCGVAVGGTVGHCLCTGLAVIGGRMIAQKISVRTGKVFFPLKKKVFIYLLIFREGAGRET